MAEDDDRKTDGDDGSAGDPWANLDQPAGDKDDAFDFSFDGSLDTEAAAPSPETSAAAEQAELPPPADEPFADTFATIAADAADATSPPAVEAEGDDTFSEEWLDDAAEMPAPTASADADAGGDESVASNSSVQIGSGESGIADTSGVDPEAWPTDEAAAEEHPATIAFEGGLENVAVAATAAGKPRRASGGLGQVAGIVGGGVMSIPIVVGILLWGFQRDPFGAAKVLPSFLLPQKFRDQGTPSGFPQAPSLDDASAQAAQALEGGATAGADAAAPDAVPAVDGDSGGAPAVTTDQDDPTAAVAVDPPATEPAADPAVPPVPDMPLDDVAAVPPAEPSAEPATDPASEPGSETEPVVPPADIAALPIEPMEDAPGDAVTTFESPAAPPPLDFASLDGAVADAGEALALAASVEAIEGPAHDRGLVSWYRSLADVGSELVALEAEAVESGGSWDAAAERLAALRDAIAAQPALADDLERLARNWLDYGRRDSDGVILPVTFMTTRRVGPNWYSTVSLAEADGGAREVAVLSRREPAAVEGDRLLVLGVLFDDGVVYAAEIGPLSSPAEEGGFFGAGGL